MRFCRTTFESKAAGEINALYAGDGVRAMAPVRILKERKKGCVREVEKPLLIGYVFVFGDAKIEPAKFYAAADAIRVLRYPGGDCELTGEDRAYAEFVYANGGVIGVSDVLCEGNSVKVLSGPLKEYRGTIIKMDRRKQRVVLRIGVGGVERDVHVSVNILYAV